MKGEALTEAFMAASRTLVGIAVRSIEAAEVPLTVPQHRCLVVLATEGPLTIGAIAVELGVNQSNASRLSDRLERIGFVTRQPSERDGRSVSVRLTEAGQEALDQVAAVRRREIRSVVDHMEVADADTVVAALAAFSEAAHEVAPHLPSAL